MKISLRIVSFIKEITAITVTYNNGQKGEKEKESHQNTSRQKYAASDQIPKIQWKTRLVFCLVSWTEHIDAFNI